MASSSDFLINHAYKNVWCTPGQDRQYIVAPSRLSKVWGAQATIKVGMRHYNLPTPSDWYHVFVLGDIPPTLLGMETIYEQWISVRAHCVQTSLLIDLYLNNGIHFPTHRAYFLYTRYGSLAIAFQATALIGDLGTTQPYIRWRSNAYFDGATEIPANKGIEIEGITYKTNDQFYVFQNLWRAAKLATGKALAFVNGKRVLDINPTTAAIGDVLEYVRDASIKEVIEFPVSDLLSFDSTLDGKGKFLLARTGLGETIDFKDDVDIYLLKYIQAANYRGMYYHQNQVDALRMVTHRDYSIVSAYLQTYIDDHGWSVDDDLRVELIVRHSGWNRALVDEHHRIKELYKLSQEDRLDAMIGQQASVDVWKVAELENSKYPQLMRTSDGQITLPMVQEAYGYNAVSKLLGDTPMKVPTGTKWVTLPYGLQSLSTVYEYSSQGRLIGWYIHDTSIEYPIRNAECRYIEAYRGRAGLGLGSLHNVADYQLVDGAQYRFYVADKIDGVASDNWTDVTGNSEYYQISNGVVQWNVNFNDYATVIRHDQNILSYNVELDYRDRTLIFTVQMKEVGEGGTTQIGTMDIPPGELDVFLNGWLLIEDIDYHVNWPEICVVNKENLNEGPVQTLTIRGRGFCSSSLERDLPRDFGFVSQGVLSRNAWFHSRGDKVCRISIGGSLYTRDEVTLSEDGMMQIEGVNNGTPYQIVHPIIPVGDVIDLDTYTYREISLEVDAAVEAYLTTHLPEVPITTPNPITTWYKIYSPFACKLIYDMINGILPMDDFKGEYSTEFMAGRLAGYEWILAFDPALKTVDSRYVIIHPHPETSPVELTVYQYRLLNRAVQYFLNGNVTISRQVVIVEEGYEHEEVDHPHPYRLYSEVPGVTSF